MNTRKTLAAVVAALLAVAGMALAATTPSAAAGPDDIVVFTAQLLAENESDGGDEGASGVAIVTVDKLNDVVCIETVTSGLTLTSGHIHSGAAGVNGGVVVNFEISGVDPDNCVSPSSEVVDGIDADPASRYVNLHTGTSPGGAVRGQLVPAGPSALSPLVTTMDGPSEFPGPGDPDGTGSAYLWVDIVANEVCYTGSTDLIAAPTAAHIHDGAPGASGPPVVTLDHTDLFGCQTVAAPLALDLAVNPGDYYVNVHNGDFPAGAVRGQLGTRGGAGLEGSRRVVAPVRGLEEVAPGDPGGSGMAVLDLQPNDGVVCFELNLEGFEDPTAAHIHRGPADTNGPVVVDFNVPANGEVGCVDSTVDLVNEMLVDPTAFYVNVHTATFPAGAGRGQLVVLPQGIAGTVTDGADPTPAPVPDGWVQLHHFGFGAEGAYVDGVPTDPKGRYVQYGLTTGDQIASWRDGDFTAGYVHTILPGQTVRRDIDFADVAYVEGTVTSFVTGDPLEGINVCVDNLLPPLPYDEPVDPTPCGEDATAVVTDAAGAWWMEVTPGLWGPRMGDPAGAFEPDVSQPEVAVVPTGDTHTFDDFPLFACDGTLFSDVGAAHAFCLEIAWMALTEISTGFADGTWRPTSGVTRQALAAFIWRLAGEPEPDPGAPTFSDVPEDHPFYAAITWMAGAGYANGFPDGTFRPGGVLTRQALSAFFYRLAGEPPVDLPDPLPFTDVPAAHPFVDEITWMAETGLSTGFPVPGGTAIFKPGDDVTRQALSAFLYRGVRQQHLIAFG